MSYSSGLPNGGGRTGSQWERDRDAMDRAYAERAQAAKREREWQRRIEDERIREIVREERAKERR